MISQPLLFQDSPADDLPGYLAYPYDLQYFKPEEFKRCSPACDIMDMVPEFMYRLDLMRQFASIPIVINSAYRSFDYEVKHGRPGTSSHTKGIAADIRCRDTKERYLLLAAAFYADIPRIGIGKNFIHVDIDTSKPSCIWLYD